MNKLTGRPPRPQKKDTEDGAAPQRSTNKLLAPLDFSSNHQLVPLPTKDMVRVPTPGTDRSHLGELMFRSGVLPFKVTNAPERLVHQTTLLSPWTTTENTMTLAQFLLPPVEATQNGKAYITEPRHAAVGSKDQTVAQRPARLQPISSSATAVSSSDIQNALQQLQDKMKSAVHSKDIAHRADESIDRTKTTLSPSDELSMSKAELWRYKHSLLPEGVRTPTFDNEEQVRYVPMSYTEKRMYDIRMDPQKWFELKERVALLTEEKKKHESHAIIARNRNLAASVSPARKRDALLSRKESLGRKIEEAREKRTEMEQERLSQILTHEQKTKLRHEKQAESLIVFAALGARLNSLVRALSSHRSQRHLRAAAHAVMVIQRAVRKHVLHSTQMTSVQAFLVRARYLRRFVTRCKVKIFRPKYVDIVKNFLQSVRFETRILMAFRKLHDRVVRAQRIVRLWQSEKRFMTEIRTVQWTKAVAKRSKDFALMSTKGSSIERDLASKELDDLRNISDNLRAKVIENYRQETRSVFLEHMRIFMDARREIQRAADARTAALLRKQMPKKPKIRILIPTEQIERMIRNASRHVRLQKSMNS